jgi:hypothetical protein
MANNPLQQYFRQPKIFVGLPSKGIYNKLGSLSGDVTNMPVYGMTGMDEMLLKTPDALMSGESTVRVVESCCPFIKDGWEVTTLDNDLILAAIRIATYGNEMEINHVCSECKTENDYTLDMSSLIDHYSNYQYDNKITLKELVVKMQPLTYRQSTDFSLENYKLQQRMIQANALEDTDERKLALAELYEELGLLQRNIFNASIEAVEVQGQVVSERSYIAEWLANCDKEIFDSIKLQINKNRDAMDPPAHHVKCDTCGHEADIAIELDQSNFFVQA